MIVKTEVRPAQCRTEQENTKKFLYHSTLLVFFGYLPLLKNTLKPTLLCTKYFVLSEDDDDESLVNPKLKNK